MRMESLAAAPLRSEPSFAGRCQLEDGFHLAPWIEFDLAALQSNWLALSSAAGTPNSFLEPWFLRPSLSTLDPAGYVELALLVEDGALTGLLPLATSGHYQARPIPHLESWLHANMFCGAPLVAAGRETAFWRALLPALDGRAKTQWFAHLRHLPADSTITAALIDLCAEDNRACRTVYREERALLRSGLDRESHLARSFSRKRRKELARLDRRFRESGDIRLECIRSPIGLEAWIDAFLALEQRGWKGAEGSALACDDRTRELFREVLCGAAEAGALERIAFFDGAEPVAMLATFLSGHGAFAFKTAYDEEFARFSPGMLLQVENLALLDDPDLAWCDSCAAEDHPMIDRIWPDRRSMVWLTVAVGSGWRRKLGEVWAGVEAWRMEHRR